MGWGFSRDDVEGSFFSRYLELGIFGVSPFESIDRDGVGRLVRIAVDEGRAARPDLKIGVCGEHGGDPDSVHFFHEAGLDYVSCSPFRVRSPGWRPAAPPSRGSAATAGDHPLTLLRIAAKSVAVRGWRLPSSCSCSPWAGSGGWPGKNELAGRPM